MRRLWMCLALAASLAAGCDKDDKKTDGSGKPSAPVGKVDKDGVRRIPVEAGDSGYQPDKITAAAGEKLILEFTRTTEARCLAQVRVADGPIVELPVGKMVEVPVTAPADKGATLRFACGMDMQTGVIAVN